MEHLMTAAADDIPEALRNLHRLSPLVILAPKTVEQVFGGRVSGRTLRRSKLRRQITERIFGFTVGDIIAVINGEKSL
jgi:hypothetical protein